MKAESAFGSQVRNRREALGLTRKALAQWIDCSMETVRKIESGERHPSRQIAELLADALSISPEARENFIHFSRGKNAASVGERPMPGARATNLPAPMTSFIDRTTELASLRARLLQPDVRLLTLVGPPGIGKTRLSIQAGLALLGSFADGVWFVPLAAINDPALVLPAIASHLDLGEGGPNSLLKRLHAYLQPREMLFVLDNFEHLLNAAPQITDLLKACPTLKIMATSRQPLQVYGEHEFRVPALSLPPRDQPRSLTFKQWGRFDALKLFVARVQTFQPDFELDADNVSLVARICIRLDGMPLAIELAAAQLRRFTPQALLHALDVMPLQSLVATARDLEPRQHTLRGAIQWSYDLLSASERAVFDQLGVFAGGWTTDAALAVCQLPDASLLQALADQNLIQRESESRWMMLEMIREFALEQLSGDRLALLHQRHAAYFTHLLQVNRENYLLVMEVEQHNVRVALQWLIDHTDPLAVELFRCTNTYFDQRGLQGEARRIMSRLLTNGFELTPKIRLDLLGGLAIFAWQQGDVEEGLRCAHGSMMIARTLNEPVLLADVLITLAHAYIEMDDAASANATALEALRIGRDIQDPVQVVGALTQLGEAALMQHDVGQAEACFTEAYGLCQSVGWSQSVYAGLACKGMGEIALSQRDYDGALRFLREGVTRNQAAVLRLLTLDVLAGVIGTMPRRTTADVCRAAKIWGATTALHENMGSGISPDDRRRRDGLIAEARSRINRKAFEAAWAEGRGLSMDEAVALAME